MNKKGEVKALMILGLVVLVAIIGLFMNFETTVTGQVVDSQGNYVSFTKYLLEGETQEEYVARQRFIARERQESVALGRHRTTEYEATSYSRTDIGQKYPR